MGGISFDDDWEVTSPLIRNLVLIGRTGNGKSATGNSILQKKAFISKPSSNGVTTTSQKHTTTLTDGQILRVIDTPGLFDLSDKSEFIGEEIVKCIDMAKEGIHAALFVLSVRSRFTTEEEAAIQKLQNFLGNKINDYMILVFTGGDDLEANNQTMKDYLGCNCPEPLKKILNLCENRYVLFDNKTTDENKKAEQVQVLLSLVDKVLEKNGREPFTNDIFVEMPTGALKLHDEKLKVQSLKGWSEDKISKLNEQLQRSNEDQMKRITEMVESKLEETVRRLEQQLADEKAARSQAEESVRSAQKKSEDEIRKLRENLEKAQRETEELKRKASAERETEEKASGACNIL